MIGFSLSLYSHTIMFLISLLNLLYCTYVFKKSIPLKNPLSMSWQPCTSSIANNTHILESFHMYLFLESDNHLVPRLK